jgi:hypothetical protein
MCPRIHFRNPGKFYEWRKLFSRFDSTSELGEEDDADEHSTIV